MSKALCTHNIYLQVYKKLLSFLSIFYIYYNTDIIIGNIPNEYSHQGRRFHNNFVKNYGFDGKVSTQSICNHFEGTDYRTNNACEVFHSKANKMLRSKPHLFQYVTLIQE